MQELKSKHYNWVGKMIASDTIAEKHTKISIQFALEILENITNKSPNDVITNILNEIEELKQQL